MYSNYSRVGGLLSSGAARRLPGVLHRSAVAAPDKLLLPETLTLSAITEAGSTLANVAYFAAVSAYNRWGPTGPGPIPASITPAANQAVRIAFAQVAGAVGYDVFLSTAAAPLWVTRITEAQRAAGGIVSSVGGYAAGGAASSIDIGIVGTGVATSSAPYGFNNAYTPAAITAIGCDGFAMAHILAQLSPADLRSAPGLTLVPFLANQASPNDWHQGAAMVFSMLGADGASLEQDWAIEVDGATGLVICVSLLTGQAPSANVWVELA